MALLLSCLGELPLVGVKLPKEAVVGLDGRVEIGQRGRGDGQGADVREVDFLCGTGSQPMVWIERAWFVAGTPAHAACGDAMGVDPDLQRDHSTDEIGVEIANVALMGDKPCKVIQITGCRRAVEARDLLGDVLLQSHHLKLR